jgi:predicted CoA-substrate-specific enzyme activase
MKLYRMDYFAGIDIGSSATKAVVISDDRKVIGHAVVDSGADFKAAAEQAYAQARQQAGCSEADPVAIVTTGYGRRNLPSADATRTEISCHADGSYHYFPRAHTLVDIGGQDSKIIKIGEGGPRTNFKMNRKCAAGTGAFLAELANRLKIPLEHLDEMAKQAQNEVEIGSYCTVFSATEILARIREGANVADIVKGIFGSVIKRVTEMDSLQGNVVMTGGVIAHNPFLVNMFEQKTGNKIYVPPMPQFAGALGAALYSLASKGKGEENAGRSV